MQDSVERPSGIERPGSESATRWRDHGFRLVVELLVVFAGVYGASAFAEFQKARELEARRQQIRQALIEEIGIIVHDAGGISAELGTMITEIRTAAERKSYAPLQPFLNPMNPRADVWDATLQAGGLDLFDVPTFWSIAKFYNEVNRGLAQLQQMRDLSEQMLLPVAGSSFEEYYEPTTGRLRPRYAWYITGVERLVATSTLISALGDTLLAELSRQYLDGAAPAVAGAQP